MIDKYISKKRNKRSLYTLNKASDAESGWFSKYIYALYADGLSFGPGFGQFFFFDLLHKIFKLSLSLYCAFLTFKIITIVLNL